jgi:hypothetical protein
LDLLKSSSHPPTNHFIATNFALSFFPLIAKPTRITSSTATLIDNIFTNVLDQPSLVHGIILTDISDHLPIFHVTYRKLKAKQASTTPKRDLNSTNKATFQEHLSKVNWDEILNTKDAQAAYSKFQNIISTNFQKSFPFKSIKSHYCSKMPWLTKGLKNAISNKHKLYVRYLKHPSMDNETIYKKHKNKLNHLLKISERNHYQSMFQSNKNNLRKTWSIIKEVINKNRKKN